MRTLSFRRCEWHDMHESDEKSLRALQERYGFHELDIEDCLSTHEQPKFEEYPQYLFLVLHIPRLNVQTGRVQKAEVNVFIGKDFVVSVHDGNSEQLIDKFWNSVKASPKLQRELLGKGAPLFLYELLHALFLTVTPLVEDVSRAVRRLEDQLFESNDEHNILRDILALKRNIISLRSLLHPQRAILTSFQSRSQKIVSGKLNVYFDDVEDIIDRQWSALETAKELIDALQETHESWLTHKTNEVIRTLTVFSVIMLPLTLLASIYGMNVALPQQENPQALLLVLGGMLAITLVLMVIFKFRRWLYAGLS